MDKLKRKYQKADNVLFSIKVAQFVTIDDGHNNNQPTLEKIKKVKIENYLNAANEKEDVYMPSNNNGRQRLYYLNNVDTGAKSEDILPMDVVPTRLDNIKIDRFVENGVLDLSF